jgi:DNA-binding NarL/FixJ family response regulator
MLTDKYAFRAALLAAIGNARYRSESIPKESDQGEEEDQQSIILSELETKMLVYFAEGLSLKEITLKTNHTQNTIKTYSRNLLQKLGVNNRQKALLRAIQIGLFRPQNKQ